MPYLKFAFEKRSLESGENPQVFCERLLSKKAFLLESGTIQSTGESVAGGRYSYIGYDPFALIESKNGNAGVQVFRDFCDWKKSSGVKLHHGDALESLRHFVQYFRFNGKLPVPFCGGVAGFFTYDFGTTFAGIQQKVFDDLGLPDFVFYFVDKVLAIDHQTDEVYFLSFGSTTMDAERKIQQIKSDVESSYVSLVHTGNIGEIHSNLTFDQYARKLSQVKKFLIDGDTYQVNFSQRFTSECDVDSWRIYRNLQQVNPSPYSCYFDCDDYQIVSCSPELLLCKRGNNVFTKPIKGTVPRQENVEKDSAEIEKLLSSEKNEAELSMIVDLERNDFGKVCDPGSVRVSAHRAIEKYAHVIHTVSTVEGKLSINKDFFDAFVAMFPGGSITGCPKKRTMEIIDQLEDFKRGVYTGSAGFIGFDGNGDMNILIRTMLLKDRKIYFQAGGGIVIDSDTLGEYDESLQKAKSLLQALNFGSK